MRTPKLIHRSIFRLDIREWRGGSLYSLSLLWMMWSAEDTHQNSHMRSTIRQRSLSRSGMLLEQIDIHLSLWVLDRLILFDVDGRSNSLCDTEAVLSYESPSPCLLLFEAAGWWGISTLDSTPTASSSIIMYKPRCDNRMKLLTCAWQDGR